MALEDGDVGVVVAGRHVRDDPELRSGRGQEGVVDAIVQQRHDRVCTADRLVELGDGERPVVR